MHFGIPDWELGVAIFLAFVFAAIVIHLGITPTKPAQTLSPILPPELPSAPIVETPVQVEFKRLPW